MQFDACVGNGLTTIQPGMPAVRSIRSMPLSPLGERRIFPAAREIEFQAGHRLPVASTSAPFDMGIVIVVDRGAVDDLGNLIARVIVVEDIAVQCQRAVEQRVLGAQFEGLDIFRLEGQRMIDERI